MFGFSNRFQFLRGDFICMQIDLRSAGRLGTNSRAGECFPSSACLPPWPDSSFSLKVSGVKTHVRRRDLNRWRSARGTRLRAWLRWTIPVLCAGAKAPHVPLACQSNFESPSKAGWIAVTPTPGRSEGAAESMPRPRGSHCSLPTRTARGTSPVSSSARSTESGPTSTAFPADSSPAV